MSSTTGCGASVCRAVGTRRSRRGTPGARTTSSATGSTTTCSGTPTTTPRRTAATHCCSITGETNRRSSRAPTCRWAVWPCLPNAGSRRSIRYSIASARISIRRSRTGARTTVRRMPRVRTASTRLPKSTPPRHAWPGGSTARLRCSDSLREREFTDLDLPDGFGPDSEFEAVARRGLARVYWTRELGASEMREQLAELPVQDATEAVEVAREWSNGKVFQVGMHTMRGSLAPTEAGNGALQRRSSLHLRRTVGR